MDTSLQMSLQLSREEIRETVRRLAAEISRDYAGKRPLLLGVLKGAFIFLADLVREIDIPVTVDFIRAQSYKGSTTTGEVILHHKAENLFRTGCQFGDRWRSHDSALSSR